MAADIYWEDWGIDLQQSFASVASMENWSCGLHPQFVHIDRRFDLGLPAATFEYPEWDNRFSIFSENR
jgi:hypothetical protein